MKVEAKLKMKGVLDEGHLVKVPIELSTISDSNALVRAVQDEFYKLYGYSVYPAVDFGIVNHREIMAKLQKSVSGD